MRLKTLGVFVTVLLAAFTLYYWVTDDGRREAIGIAQDEELVEFGELVFSEDPTEPAAAGCAQCHGPEGMGGEEGAPAIGPNLHSISLADKLEANPDYVELVIRNGGVVVSGNVNSPMPAWEDTLNRQQIEAVEALVVSWAEETAANVPEDVEVSVEGGEQVYLGALGCAGCHGQQLEGGIGPNLQSIGSELITEGLPVPPADIEGMIADYEQDPTLFLEKWIRDSWGNYNDGADTQMPQFPEEQLSENNLQALITFLLAQTGE